MTILESFSTWAIVVAGNRLFHLISNEPEMIDWLRD